MKQSKMLSRWYQTYKPTIDEMSLSCGPTYNTQVNKPTAAKLQCLKCPFRLSILVLKRGASHRRRMTTVTHFSFSHCQAGWMELECLLCCNAISWRQSRCILIHEYCAFWSRIEAFIAHTWPTIMLGAWACASGYSLTCPVATKAIQNWACRQRLSGNWANKYGPNEASGRCTEHSWW